jgi:hypothetical protein
VRHQQQRQQQLGVCLLHMLCLAGWVGFVVADVCTGRCVHVCMCVCSTPAAVCGYGILKVLLVCNTASPAVQLKCWRLNQRLHACCMRHIVPCVSVFGMHCSYQQGYSGTCGSAHSQCLHACCMIETARVFLVCVSLCECSTCQSNTGTSGSTHVPPPCMPAVCISVISYIVRV